MQFPEGKGMRAGQWFPNEIFRNDDINFLNEKEYTNMTAALAAIAEQGILSGADVVIAGLLLEWDNLLTSNLRAGMAVSPSGYYFQSGSWGFGASAGDIFSVTVSVDTSIAVLAGGSQPRIDVLEVRPIRIEYDSKSRNFKDPVTGQVTSANIDTKIEYGFGFQVLQGTEGASPSALTHTAGWIKLAEIYVAASATAIDQDDIKDIRDADTWTTEADATILPASKVNDSIPALTAAPGGSYSSISAVAGNDLLTLIMLIADRLRTADGIQSGYIKGRHTNNLNVSKSGDYIITDSDYVGVVGMTTGATDRTVTLPTAADNADREITLVKVDSAAGKAILDGEGSETINGTLIWEVTEQWGRVKVKSDGSNWIVLDQWGSFLEYSNTSLVTFTTTKSIWVNATGHSLTVPKGVWEVSYIVLVNVQSTTGADIAFKITLSKANNTEDDVELTNQWLFYEASSADRRMANVLTRKKIVALTSSATFYLNGYISSIGTVGYFRAWGTATTTFIRAKRIG
jgi:hypothetical protein